MPLQNNQFTSIVDVAKQFNNGESNNMGIEVAEVLMRDSQIMASANFITMNTKKGHKTLLRTSLAQAEPVIMNAGVTASKGSVTSMIEVPCTIGSRLEIDEKELREMDDPATYMATQVSAHTQTLNNKMEDDIFKGDKSKDEHRIDGLAQRYNKLNYPANDGRKTQVFTPIMMAGKGPITETDNLTSMYVVGWGQTSVNLFADPRVGSAGGISAVPFKHEPKQDDRGNTYYNEGVNYEMNYGLSIADYRGVARACNISENRISDVDMVATVRKLVLRTRKAKNTRPVLYMNETCFEALTAQIQDNKYNLNITFQEWQGFNNIGIFMGLPIVVISDEALGFTEKAVK